MTGNKVLALLTAVLPMFLNTAVHAYDMPIGIPAPDFGPVLGNPVDVPPPPRPPVWPGGEAPGYYYIDNTAANATDNANDYGYPNRPRKSIPNTLAAGSVVEVRGGPYQFARAAYFTLQGTATRPVFVYGVNHPVLDNPEKAEINGAYFVFDGFFLRNSRIYSQGMTHAIIRNTEIQGNASTPNGLKVAGSNIVLYNNDIHHHQGDDSHGVTLAEGSHDIWILGNRLHHNGGDGIQFCHKCSTSPPHHVFIGGNALYSNRENGVDLKYCHHVIISGNDVYNHWPSFPGIPFCYDDGSGCTTGSSGSDGASIMVGSDGMPTNIWILFNDIHNSNKGIHIRETYNGFALGNVIHDVYAVGIAFETTGEGPVTAAFNTIHNTDRGITGPWEPGTLSITMEDNILSGISDDSINIQGIAAGLSTASNNLFYNGGGSISIRWDTHVALSSGPAIDGLVRGNGNLIGNPGYRNPAAGDFHVLDSGAGVDQANSRLIALNDRFRLIFGNGVSILRDFDDVSRSSSGTDHDIGAYESYSTMGTAPPLPPTLK